MFNAEEKAMLNSNEISIDEKADIIANKYMSHYDKIYQQGKNQYDQEKSQEEGTEGEVTPWGQGVFRTDIGTRIRWNDGGSKGPGYYEYGKREDGSKMDNEISGPYTSASDIYNLSVGNNIKLGNPPEQS